MHLVSSSELPPLTVFPRPHVPGAAFEEDGILVSRKGYEVTAWPSVTLAEAFAPDPEHDTHAVMYAGLQHESNEWVPSLPRLTLGSFAKVKTWGLCDEVVGTWLILDLDLPEHEGPWTDDLRERYQRLFDYAGQRDDLFRNPTFFYCTKGGLRLGWALDMPCPIDGARGLQDLLMGMISSAAEVGLSFDPVCRDPTRLMRLPRVARAVTREDPATRVATEVITSTWTQPYYRCSFGRVDFAAQEEVPEQCLVFDVGELPAISQTALTDLTSAEAKALVEIWGPSRIGVVPISGQGGGSGAPGTIPNSAEIEILAKGAHLQYLHRLRTRATKAKSSESLIRCVEAMENPRAVYAHPATLAGLHEGILRLARSVLWVARDDQHLLTPQAAWVWLYGLASAANALRTKDARDDGTLRDEVWNAIDYYWVSQEDEQRFRDEQSRIRQAQRDLQARGFEAELASYMNRCLRGSMDSESYRTFSIVDSGRSGKWVLSRGKKGLYYEGPTHDEPTLVAYLRDCKNPLIEYKRFDPKSAKVEYLTSKELMDRYGQPGARLTMSRLVEHTEISKDSMGLVVRSRAPGMRRDIEAEYSQEVDTWLRMLGGKQQEKLLDWLACFFNIHEPCAALIIHGDPSIGKGMLGLALKNCTESLKYAEFKQVMENFQTDLAKTPFVWADENTEGGYAQADRSLINNFKRLVTGEYNSLNLKNKDHVEIEGHWRVLVTGNNVENILKFKEDVNDRDIEAVIIRTLFVESDNQACLNYLEKLGGRDYTNGWPEHAIPRHIMHLAQTRQIKRGNRLLVEGIRTEWHEAKRVNTLSTHTVLHLIAELLNIAEERCTGKYNIGAVLSELDNRGIHIQQDETGHSIMPKIVISTQNVRKAFTKLAESDRSLHIPQARDIENSLRVLSRDSKVKGAGNIAHSFRRPIQGKTERSEIRCRGIQVDPKVLLGELYKRAEHWHFPTVLGPALWQQGRPAGAVVDVDDAVAIDPRHPFKKVG